MYVVAEEERRGNTRPHVCCRVLGLVVPLYQNIAPLHHPGCFDCYGVRVGEIDRSRILAALAVKSAKSSCSS